MLKEILQKIYLIISLIFCKDIYLETILKFISRYGAIFIFRLHNGVLFDKNLIDEEITILTKISQVLTICF